MKRGDIDIDFADRDVILQKLKHHSASIISDKEQKKHNTGVYFQDIPTDPLTGRASLDYKDADDRGYYKVDMLNVSIYKDIKDGKHLNRLMAQEPDWTLLENKEIVDELFHLNGHFDIVSKLKPNSIEQLAAVLAIIRPAKRHLVNSTWQDIEQEVWQKPEDGTYFFKKAHAFGYAHAIFLQMNLLVDLAN